MFALTFSLSVVFVFVFSHSHLFYSYGTSVTFYEITTNVCLVYSAATETSLELFSLLVPAILTLLNNVRAYVWQEYKKTSIWITIRQIKNN